MEDEVKETLFHPKHPCSVRVKKQSSFSRVARWTLPKSSGTSATSTTGSLSEKSDTTVKMGSTSRKPIHYKFNNVDDCIEVLTKLSPSLRRQNHHRKKYLGSIKDIDSGDTSSESSHTMAESDSPHSVPRKLSDINPLTAPLRRQEDPDSEEMHSYSSQSSSVHEEKFLYTHAPTSIALETSENKSEHKQNDVNPCDDVHPKFAPLCQKRRASKIVSPLSKTIRASALNKDILYLNSYTGPVDVDSVLDEELSELECRLAARKQLDIQLLREDSLEPTLTGDSKFDFEVSLPPNPREILSEAKTEEASGRTILPKAILSRHGSCPVSVPGPNSPGLAKLQLLRNASDSSSNRKRTLSHSSSGPVDVDSVCELYPEADSNGSPPPCPRSNIQESTSCEPQTIGQSPILESSNAVFTFISSSLQNMFQLSSPTPALLTQNDQEVTETTNLSSLTDVSAPADDGPIDVDDYIPKERSSIEFECDSIILDEIEISRGLAGYEVGFEPEIIWNYDSYQIRRQFSRDFVPSAIREEADEEEADVGDHDNDNNNNKQSRQELAKSSTETPSKVSV